MSMARPQSRESGSTTAATETPWIHEAFERLAQRNPDATAIDCAGRRITYEQLRRGSNELAHRLRARGVGSASRVAIYMEKAPEILAAIYGVLKAGGAYVPIDPGYPTERVAFMLDDSGVELVLSHEPLPAPLADRSVHQVLVERVESLAAGERGLHPPRVETSPDDLAYVIYTSGSTGRPKGVMVCHRGLAEIVAQEHQSFDLGPDSRVLSFSSTSFDASVLEYTMALQSGGVLHQAGSQTALLGENLLRFLRQAEITHAFVPPSMLSTLHPGSLPALRVLITGGEACSSDVVERWGGERALFNIYGPTESTICSTMSLCSGPGKPSIGKPVRGTTVHLVDRHLRPVAPGREGELCIAGAGLARGYLDRPALTAERFVPNPFGVVPGARLYRTGDLCRQMADGAYDFLGRIDHQVKVRGFRIELGEIETALMQHPAIRTAVAVPNGIDGQRADSLLAFVVPEADRAAPSSSELRSLLSRSLPGFMIPQSFVALDALPLTPNGKIDRRRLQDSDWSAPRLEGDDLADHRTPSEELVLAYCAESVGHPVSLDDDFLEVGGHSLGLIRLVARLRDATGVDLPLDEVFETGSLRQIARFLDERLDEDRTRHSPIAPIGRDQPLPLSFSQQRVWYLSQMYPDNLAYNTQARLTLEGTLDVRALRVAFARVVQRQEILRTTFESLDGEGFQRIHEQGGHPLPLVDLGRCDSQPEVERLVESFVARTFDVTRLPLIRLLLIRRDARHHQLVLCEHHLVHDGWSFNVFLRDLFELYRAELAGEEPELPELEIQYADFAHWQRQNIAGDVADRHVEFWRQELRGAPTLLELPIDHPRPAMPTLRGEAPRLHLSKHLSAQLERLSRRQGVTLFMTLYAGFAVVLSRLSQQTDLVLGSAVANRRWRETENLMGMFVNNLVMRSDLSGSPTFVQLLDRIGPRVHRAYAHQDLPFDRLVEALQIRRDSSFNPIFQVMFSFHDSPPAAVDLRDLAVEIEPGISNHSAKFDFNLVVYDRARQTIGKQVAGGLSVIWEYTTDLFDETTVLRAMALFESVLTELAQDPHRRVDEVSPFAGSQRLQILSEWNDTDRDLTDPLFPVLFERNAAASPGARALVFQSDTWTYAELDQRVESLARRLVARGVGREVLVGLMLERSPETLIAALAVWRAGGAFLPLDPDYPEERLRFMLEDSQARWLITQRSLELRWKPMKTPAILVDEAVEDSPPDGERAEAAPQNLAYVLYTSGSTGQPKGVEITHRSLASFLASMARRPGVSEHDTLLALTSTSFDISLLELFLPLSVGGTVALVDRETTLDGERLAAAIEATGATVLQATPSGYFLLLDAGWRNPRALKLLCGGEGMPPLLARRLTDAGHRLWNVYGPTETTIWSTVDAVVESAAPTLGRPIDNTRVFVTDPRQRAVPLGAPGELLIGGAGVARGYRRQPALTAARFIPDALSGRPGERLYRTGDLVRQLADGRLAYLGRIDRQVKVRGHRIELGEIEAILSMHPGIDQAVVLARLGALGQAELVAFLTPAPGPAAQELRAHLREHLPEYMTPSSFVPLDALPQTSNLKVDRKALAEMPIEPVARREPGSGRWLDPQEETLGSVWRQALDGREVRANDDFFELGGNSLLATRLVARIRQTLQQDLSVRDLMETRTIRGLSRRLRGRGTQLSSWREDAIEAALDADPVLSFGQQRIWLFEQRANGAPVYNMPLAYGLEGELDIGALRRALARCVGRHQALRTTFDPRDGRPELQPAPSWRSLLPIVDLAAHGDVREPLAAAARRPFDLAFELPIRTVLFRLAAARHVLLVDVHHIAADGWSWYLLLDELGSLYRAEHEGLPHPLPAPPVDYPDFARWERQAWTEERLRPSLEYWREQLDGVEALPLPFDRPRPTTPDFRGDRCQVHVSREAADRLEAMGRRHGATPFVVLAAAFAVLLTRHSPRRDVAFTSPAAGRERLETEGIVGFFLRTLVLRLTVDPEARFPDFLQRVRDLVLAAHHHGEVPLQRLVELVPYPSAFTHPLLQLSLSLQQERTFDLALPEIEATRLPLDTATAKFDLLLDLTPGPDGLSGHLEFSSELFDRSTITGLTRRWSILVAALANDCDRRLFELPILSPEERQQILSTWGRGPRHQAEPWPIHRCFERTARQHAESTALRFGDLTISYDALNRSANRLARELRHLGVGMESRVGLCLERSPDVVVAMLAILKAGAAYVPLDPAYPHARLAHLIDDADLDALITTSSLAPALPIETDLPCLHLNRRRESADLSEENLGELGCTAENLAYVMYTSGSTGNPKGVGVPHRAVVRLVRDSTFLEMGSSETFLLFAPISFDASTLEIWAPLLNGGTLCICPPGAMTTKQLADTLRKERVSTLWLTAGLFHLMVEEHLDELAQVRQLLAGGDVLSPDKVSTMLSAAPHCRLINGYGPTENTTFTTCFDAGRNRWTGPSVPIGRPIDQTTVYVLDPSGRPVPPRCEGDLYTGGAGLARGYLGSPRLTASRFVPDPFSDLPGSRLYRTGDRARFSSGGDLEFLGRRDDQLKIRGFRIEPGEVRHALEKHSAISSCEVLGAADPSTGELALVAYLVAAGPAEQAGPVETGHLRSFLQQTLPQAMIPSSFVWLDALPLTANGKVNRNALPAPWMEREAVELALPTSPVERTVAELWGEVLNTDRVSLTDDFFASGGHSLTGMRLVARLSEEFDLDLPFQLLFESLTVEKLASAIDRLLLAEIEAMGEQEALDALRAESHLHRAGPS
jgi:amino acid adenylation domain-containing protein